MVSRLRHVVVQRCKPVLKTKCPRTPASSVFRPRTGTVARAPTRLDFGLEAFPHLKALEGGEVGNRGLASSLEVVLQGVIRGQGLGHGNLSRRLALRVGRSRASSLNLKKQVR